MADTAVREPMPEVIEGAGEIGAAMGAEMGELVDALRRDGAGRIDPVRFRFIEALARRGAALDGDAQRIVRARLATAVVECRACLTQAAAKLVAAGEPAASDPETHPAAALSPLAALVRDIDALSGADAGAQASNRAEGRAGDPMDSPGEDRRVARRELKSLRHFRKDWSRLGVEQQLACALAQGPRNAGPLNSHGLILQSLQAMRNLSPACLERMMAWLDTLLWLDAATAAPAPAPAEKPPPRPPADRKRKAVRTKAR